MRHNCALTSDCVEEIDAQRVLGYALFKEGKNTKLSYPLEKFHSDVSGRSFHNGRFIQRMREKAATLSKYTFLPSYRFAVTYYSLMLVKICPFFIFLSLIMINLLFSVKLEQGTVTSLLEENKTISGVQYKTKDGQEHTAYAPLTIVCDGCFSNLRRALCNPKVKLLS